MCTVGFAQEKGGSAKVKGKNANSVGKGEVSER